MNESNEKTILKEFRQIPGVGKSIALDLYNLGYRSIDELKGQNPQEMYDKHCYQSTRSLLKNSRQIRAQIKQRPT